MLAPDYYVYEGYIDSGTSFCILGPGSFGFFSWIELAVAVVMFAFFFCYYFSYIL